MDTTQFSRRTYGWLIAVLVGSVAVAFIWAEGLTEGDPLKETLQKAAVTLVFASVLAGVVRLLVDDFSRCRRRRAEQLRFSRNVLDDLKSVYDRVERARLLIPAHRSALTLGNEMRDLIEARVTLLNVGRALRLQPEAFTEPETTELRGCVVAMAEYLSEQIDDFQENYKPIADQQRIYEGLFDAAIKREAVNEGTDEPVTGPTVKDVEQPVNEAWLAIEALDLYKDFVGQPGTNPEPYDGQFVGPLDVASNLVRDVMTRTSGGSWRCRGGQSTTWNK